MSVTQLAYLLQDSLGGRHRPAPPPPFGGGGGGRPPLGGGARGGGGPGGGGGGRGGPGGGGGRPPGPGGGAPRAGRGRRGRPAGGGPGGGPGRGGGPRGAARPAGRGGGGGAAPRGPRPPRAGGPAGEEFALAFPDTRLPEAFGKLEQLRLEVASHTIVLPSGAQLRLTASAGLATLGDDGADLRTLLQAADQRLLEAKRSGRNRVSMTAPTRPQSGGWRVVVAS
ncbi:MAG: diguanylate cyclase [Gemmatimonadetes bacterium]|nr:diguanylate cyclase [Gemmatimonadota bacterium]